jgi:hypothetical protein
MLLNLLCVLLTVFAIFATAGLMAMTCFIIYSDIKDYKNGIKRYPTYPR